MDHNIFKSQQNKIRMNHLSQLVGNPSTQVIMNSDGRYLKERRNKQNTVEFNPADDENNELEGLV